MKQLSLMLFFKPAGPKTAPLSSPLKTKNGPTALPELEVSDKENDTFLGEQDTSDTPLTSEIGTTPVRNKANIPKSSPVEDTKSISKKPLASSNSANAPQSSPVSKRRSARDVKYAEESDDDETVSGSSRKKRRIVESDDDEDAFEPDNDDNDDDMSDFIVEDDISEVASDNEEEEEEEEEPKSKARSKKKAQSLAVEKKGGPGTFSPKPSASSAPSSLGNKFKADSSYKSAPSTAKAAISPPKAAKKSFAKENEERYQWLVDIKDGERRPVDHPEYDSRTLYVPSSAWAKFTAFEKQYWEIKAKMWDTVVFFKKGKFYELYENDATIANSEFELKIAGGGRANMKLAGIPEMSFEYWAKEFISHGYKVAKVDQKESLLAKEMRGGGSKEEKIIKRELTGVLTAGTLTNMDMISGDMAIYCVAIKEKSQEDGSKVFGVAFVDTATSELNLIELNDDSECTKLDTLITQIRPKEVLCEKNNLCSTATKILKFNSHNGHQIWNNLNADSEFWDYDAALENLVKSKYYEAEDLDDYSRYPKILVDFKDNKKVAFNAFGGLLYYLKLLKLDESVMTLANIKEYSISKNASSHMLLDGITLTNLEIMNNSFDGSDKGTLLKLLNRAITPFGKRMLKNWILHPLMKADDINERYDSVDYLMNQNPDFRVALENGIAGLPDLERLLARIHSKTLKFKDFLKVIESFERVAKLMQKMQGVELPKAGILVTYIASFAPEIHECLCEWEDAFDRQQAMNDIIVPALGVDEQFDESSQKMDALEAQLNGLLKTYKKVYNSQEICYRDSGKEIFLIEVPTKIKLIPKDWQQMGSTSKVKRYWSPEVRKLARGLMEQRETHKMVCDSLRSRMYEKFDRNYSVWKSAVQVVGNIDCVLSITKASETIGYPSCRPQFEEQGSGFVEFAELRHPCFSGTKEFIPNDVFLGGESAKFGLLTGANAAGKSTLMRTTALAVILAQIGCYVPSLLAKLAPVDKIMTRLGANDNIMQGKSTFYVELSETKKILSNATSRSLVILDELGRGGSSSDGYAIAEAVLHHLATHVQPLGFFATHYGSLGQSFVHHPQVRPLRMGIIVEKTSRNITFLYKLEEGTASGSFGMNVAAMCGISNKIVEEAEEAAKRHEQTSKLKQMEGVQATSLGLQSDVVWISGRYDKMKDDVLRYDEEVRKQALANVFGLIGGL